ncbi:MAG: pantetheine-phosphate adenylyltransferase [Patescibacteria group bacterium]
MSTAIYAFSGDPITFGHINIIERAAKIFDKIIVAIGVNPDKKYTFSLEERVEMARQSLSHLPEVRVLSFQGLLVDFAYEQKADVIVKGVRNAADFNYEAVLNQLGDSQKLGLETVLLPADPKLAHVSSSAVKALQREQGLIHEFVSLSVKSRLEERLSGQYIIGVTGEIAAGKSYLCHRLVELGRQYNIPVCNIDLDEIGHEIIGSLTEPRYADVRRQIIECFGKEVAEGNGLINRKKLGEIVFSDREKLSQLNRIMYQPLLVRLRRSLYGKKGLILFNAALLIESNMSHLSNNRMILIDLSPEVQAKRMANRGLSAEQIATRLASQYDFLTKKRLLQQKIDQQGFGKIWQITGDANDQEIAEFFREIVGYFKELSI